MKTIKIMFTALLMLVVISSCEKEEFAAQDPAAASSTTNPEPNSSSEKSIAMNSNPGQSSNAFSEFNVEISAIDAYIQNQGWVNLSHESQIVDLNELVMGTKETLVKVSDSIFAKIDKIKITFGSENYIVSQLNTHFAVNFMDSKEFIIDVDQVSEAQSSILINVDLNGSLIQNTLGYAFDPVINYLDDPETGIMGHVEGAGQAIVSVENGSFTYQTYLTTNGDFFIQDMETGQYQMTVQAIYDEVINATEQEMVVLVVDGKITSIQNITFN